MREEQYQFLGHACGRNQCFFVVKKSENSFVFERKIKGKLWQQAVFANCLPRKKAIKVLKIPKLNIIKCNFQTDSHTLKHRRVWIGKKREYFFKKGRFYCKNLPNNNNSQFIRTTCERIKKHVNLIKAVFGVTSAESIERHVNCCRVWKPFSKQQSSFLNRHRLIIH